KVYRLKKRDPKKPMIILIGSLDDLRKFNIDLNAWQKKILKKVWLGKVSIVLPCLDKKFAYLHKGTKTLAFRLPKKRELLKILSISGPLVAPSANPEGGRPAETIAEAKKYFGKNIFYYGTGKISGQPSILIKLQNNKIEIIRKNSMIKPTLKL
ncbi:MAG TPA: Sua5/YciO/YrdC/YwlC family protein, partial [Patescibacteria group bacterium]|nr:Sua5/YciO/YrdC/YwlC family protein [Patescibacteria group bacterium]